MTIKNENYKTNIEVVQALSESVASWVDSSLKLGHQDKNERVAEHSNLMSILQYNKGSLATALNEDVFNQDIPGFIRGNILLTMLNSLLIRAPREAIENRILKLEHQSGLGNGGMHGAQTASGFQYVVPTS